jgi:hypothetical protein
MKCSQTEIKEGKLRTGMAVMAVPQLRRVVAGFPPRRPGFEPGSSHVGSVEDRMALGQVLSEDFAFPCQ